MKNQQTTTGYEVTALSPQVSLIDARVFTDKIDSLKALVQTLVVDKGTAYASQAETEYMTQTQIAKKLGYSNSAEISRILSRAGKRVRKIRVGLSTDNPTYRYRYEDVVAFLEYKEV